MRKACGIRSVWPMVLAGVFLLPSAQGAEWETVRGSLATANDRQEEALSGLAQILSEERVRLSDGAVQAQLESLLEDERKQADAIRELGKRTLGRTLEELTAQDRADRDQLAENQQVYADRYRRLEKSMEAKAGARPDSVFAALLLMADDEQLYDRMREAATQIEQNQLGRGLGTVESVIETLARMVDTLMQRSGTGPDDKGGGQDAFSMPSLWVKGEDQRLPLFGWGAASADAMGRILRGMKRLEELAKRQQAVADQVAQRAPAQQTADDLAREEWEIRYLALEVATDLSLLDPRLESLIRKAAGSIERAVPGMEHGPLTESVEPARQAAVEMTEAAEYLRRLWKTILQRLKQYTQQAELAVGSAHGIPHGISKEMLEMLERMAMMLIRATGALGEVIARETALIERTSSATAEAELPALRAEQAALIRQVSDEVVPYAVDQTELPAHMQRALVRRTATAVDLLKDATDRMARAETALAAAELEEAVRREQEAVELASDALADLIDTLQRLLGQLSPPGMSSQDSMASGMALEPVGGGRAGTGWAFELPEAQRDRVRQALQGSYPERYDRAIKLYYEAIAREPAGP